MNLRVYVLVIKIYFKLTSVPISVGLIYKLPSFVNGIKFSSSRINFSICLSKSCLLTFGRQALSADWFNLWRFRSGLNNRIFPSTPRNAFIPSNSWNNKLKIQNYFLLFHFPDGPKHGQRAGCSRAQNATHKKFYV